MKGKSFSFPDLDMSEVNQQSLYLRFRHAKLDNNETGFKIVLVCSDNNLFEPLKKKLYSMPDQFERIEIIDLGEIINQDFNDLVKIQTVFIEQNIIPIYLGFDKQIMEVFTAAHDHLNLTFQACLFSSDLHLFEALSMKRDVRNIIPIGFQTQFCTKSQISELLPEYISQTRLGKLKINIHLAEPFIRQANIHVLDLNIIRHSELPDMDGTRPSGLYSEEISQLAKYIGLSDHAKSIAILGLEKISEANSWDLAAQIIWYMLQGFDNRIQTDGPEITNMTILYTVESTALSEPLKFIKSTQSGKWWVQHVHDEKKFIPCSYEDYLLCCQNEIPDRILTACFH